MEVREYSRNDTQFGFELEFKDQRSSVLKDQFIIGSPPNPHLSNGSSGSMKDDSIIVILLDTEQKRDEVLKVINDQIRELKNIAISLVNPVGNF